MAGLLLKLKANATILKQIYNHTVVNMHIVHTSSEQETFRQTVFVLIEVV